MPWSPAVSAAISASTRTRVPTWVNLTVPCACDPLAGRTTAVADGPSGCIVAHDDRSSAHAASLNACFILFPSNCNRLSSGFTFCELPRLRRVGLGTAERAGISSDEKCRGRHWNRCLGPRAGVDVAFQCLARVPAQHCFLDTLRLHGL